MTESSKTFLKKSDDEKILGEIPGEDIERIPDEIIREKILQKFLVEFL